ncbi:hypothetical protein H310_07757 [Aphanomyces invadans]|uniref:Uncharacterized protein n=1 Tax=Aphanomyces invadans TaxID=157072 RepID=A0A024U0A3_9STRA|nr:hypothetical protein H310_07757 [Aphanomyces invadans]ETV99693.1 hypothetical protein H310_07757 [Aphanomyces invadans]|eukprot:XP_008871469.1 hypothetical protein H310_07757 [Aphanomyces invadans]
MARAQVQAHDPAQHSSELHKRVVCAAHSVSRRLLQLFGARRLLRWPMTRPRARSLKFVVDSCGFQGQEHDQFGADDKHWRQVRQLTVVPLGSARKLATMMCGSRHGPSDPGGGCSVQYVDLNGREQQGPP